MSATLSWNEIRKRSIEFSNEWSIAESERSDAQTFWNEFFEVFGIKRRRVAIFEQKVKKINNKDGRIDLFWPGQMLAEHKSKNEDLESAYEQATDYFSGLTEREIPRYVVVSDFQNIRIVDLDSGSSNQFHLKDLHKNIKLFGFIAGYQKRIVRSEDPVNIKAANIMANLHEAIHNVGYTGHQLELFMVRILFCLFADDSGLFEKGIFREYIEEKTRDDGSDLGQQLQLVFQILDTSSEKRLTTLDEDLQRFPYVNGGLFKEVLPIVSFDSGMREVLLNTCAFDWSQISPAVFGSMFQSIMDPKKRRNFGAHYTSERNILKLIQPLFLDSLYDELKMAGKQKVKLENLQGKLALLKFFDPACGCGNFLAVTYREIRKLELEILKHLHSEKSYSLFGGQALTMLDVSQFYGIEIEEFPARIAEVSLWLTDHQMNLELGEVFGKIPDRLPLKTCAKIVIGNANSIDWNDVVPKGELSYILGNPPYVGKQYQTELQKDDIRTVFGVNKNVNILDYVSCWFIKAAMYTRDTNISVAFVTTNSITQGEQVGVLWNELSQYNLKINFAHRTFQWNNGAGHQAGVHVVIIGFSAVDAPVKRIFAYDRVNGEPHEINVNSINPYLADAPFVILKKRRTPICTAKKIAFGNMPNDGGFLILSAAEKEEFGKQDKEVLKWVRRLMGSEEFLNNIYRYCLWLVSIKPEEIKLSNFLLDRVEKVRQYRLASRREATRKLAKSAMFFGEMRQPQARYLAIPEVSSENRFYIPIGFLEPDVIATNKLYTIENADMFDFAILTSSMHMAWVRSVSGRLKSDYQYSSGIVYNNFPWPNNVTSMQREKINKLALAVLDSRKKYSNSTLADLYNPSLMPADLAKTHEDLDLAVDRLYGNKNFSNELERVSHLFGLYKELAQHN